eukprot:ctg_93.g15
MRRLRDNRRMTRTAIDSIDVEQRSPHLRAGQARHRPVALLQTAPPHRAPVRVAGIVAGARLRGAVSGGDVVEQGAESVRAHRPEECDRRADGRAAAAGPSAPRRHLYRPVRRVTLVAGGDAQHRPRHLCAPARAVGGVPPAPPDRRGVAGDGPWHQLADRLVIGGGVQPVADAGGVVDGGVGVLLHGQRGHCAGGVRFGAGIRGVQQSDHRVASRPPQTPAQLRDRQTVRRRAPGGGAIFGGVSGAARERTHAAGYAGHSQLGPVGDYLCGRGRLHVAGHVPGGAGRDDARRSGDGERVHSAVVSAVALVGHCVPSNRACGDRPGETDAAAGQRVGGAGCAGRARLAVRPRRDRVSGRVVRVRGGGGGDRRCRQVDQRRASHLLPVATAGHAGHCGAVGRRQVHPPATAVPALRPAARPDTDRRAGRSAGAAGERAPGHRGGGAGHGAL